MIVVTVAHRFWKSFKSRQFLYPSLRLDERFPILLYLIFAAWEGLLGRITWYLIWKNARL